ncbi:unnamed protein product, partial [Ectocarpus sp. 13 AM-2016]
VPSVGVDALSSCVLPRIFLFGTCFCLGVHAQLASTRSNANGERAGSRDRSYLE